MPVSKQNRLQTKSSPDRSPPNKPVSASRPSSPPAASPGRAIDDGLRTAHAQSDPRRGGRTSTRPAHSRRIPPSPGQSFRPGRPSLGSSAARAGPAVLFAPRLPLMICAASTIDDARTGPGPALPPMSSAPSPRQAAPADLRWAAPGHHRLPAPYPGAGDPSSHRPSYRQRAGSECSGGHSGHALAASALTPRPSGNATSTTLQSTARRVS